MSAEHPMCASRGPRLLMGVAFILNAGRQVPPGEREFI
jgi:hypothetical protein